MHLLHLGVDSGDGVLVVALRRIRGQPVIGLRDNGAELVAQSSSSACICVGLRRGRRIGGNLIGRIRRRRGIGDSGRRIDAVIGDVRLCGAEERAANRVHRS